jgi:ADP-ribose pyrophosphatase YjhB (NUDIX family)
MKSRPKVEITSYISNSDKSKILLGKSKFELHWRTPYCRLGYADNFDTCCLKGLEEQLNLKIKNERLVFISTLNVISKVEKFHFIEICYFVQLTTEEEKAIDTLRTTLMEWSWMSVDEIKNKENEMYIGVNLLLKKHNIGSVESLRLIDSN